MDIKARNIVSKFLSFVLRHKPEAIGLSLDENGWANVDELLVLAAEHGTRFTREELVEVVSTNDKQRFAFNLDGKKIRANQGHSVEVELELTEKEPPAVLYHGTVGRFVEAIRAEGLKKMNRRHVHLSKDRETAEKVGERRGEAVILVVRSGEMFGEGFLFFMSENGVWLTDHVPEKYIDY
jgi:putative RNA 2'-phosphotransferase